MEATISFSHQKRRLRVLLWKEILNMIGRLWARFILQKKGKKTTEKRQKTDKIDKERNNDGQRKTERSLWKNT